MHMDTTAQRKGLPAISVLMAVYNAERFLRETLASIGNQSFQNYELIIINDGSSDGSLPILYDYSRKDHRIRIYRNQLNLGLAASLNRGLSLCRASIIARADADDLYEPERLSKQLAFMNEKRRVGVVSSIAKQINHSGHVRKIDTSPTSDSDIKEHLLFDNCIRHPGAVFRKDIVQSVGGYDEDFLTSQDYDLWARLRDRTQFHNLADPLIQYRVHPGSISKDRACQQFKDSCTITQRLLRPYLRRHISNEEISLLRSLYRGRRKLELEDLPTALALFDEIVGHANRFEHPGRLRRRFARGLLRTVPRIRPPRDIRLIIRRASGCMDPSELFREMARRWIKTPIVGMLPRKVLRAANSFKKQRM